MIFITFLLGVIIGILVRDIKFETLKIIENHQEKKIEKSAQFLEPITIKEKFNNANIIDDIL